MMRWSEALLQKQKPKPSRRHGVTGLGAPASADVQPRAVLRLRRATRL
jgi:hypothetical protein